MDLKQQVTDEEKFKRFRDTFQEYRDNGLIPDVKRFAESIDHQANMLWLSLNGKRGVPDSLIYKFCEYFNLHPGYFYGRPNPGKKTINGSTTGEKLATVMRDLHITQSELAEAAGQTQVTISRMLRDKVPLNFNVLSALRKRYRIDINAFIE